MIETPGSISNATSSQEMDFEARARELLSNDSMESFFEFCLAEGQNFDSDVKALLNDFSEILDGNTR